MYPSTAPDLFAEQPLVLFGRKPDGRAGKLHITGMSGDGRRNQHVFNINFQAIGNPAIAQLWGRSRIKNLMNQMVSGDTKVGVEAATQTALAYQLLSQYTAFVAVSDEVRVNPYQGSVSVQVPVEMPEGVSQQGIFGNAVAKKVAQQVVQSDAPELRRARRAMSREDVPMRSQMRSEPVRAARNPGDMAKFSAKSSENTGPARPACDPGDMNEPLEMASLERSIEEELEAQRSIEEELEALKAQLKGLGGDWEGNTAVPRLQIKVTGLNEQMIALLFQHLQLIQLPTGLRGDLVFEFEMSQGKVTQLVLDEQASSLQEETVINAIKRSLLTWRPSQIITSSVVLTVHIQS